MKTAALILLCVFSALAGAWLMRQFAPKPPAEPLFQGTVSAQVKDTIPHEAKIEPPQPLTPQSEPAVPDTYKYSWSVKDSAYEVSGYALGLRLDKILVTSFSARGSAEIVINPQGEIDTTRTTPNWTFSSTQQKLNLPKQRKFSLWTGAMWFPGQMVGHVSLQYRSVMVGPAVIVTGEKALVGVNLDLRW